MSGYGLSRREFLRYTGVATSVAVASACGSAAAPTTAPVQATVEPTAAPTGAVAATTAPQATTAPGTGKYREAPMLAEKVAAGALPPVDERLPIDPLVVEPVEEIGEYGGTWRQVSVGDGLGWFRMANYVEPIARWERDVDGVFPNLAEKWEWNDDATEVTVYFRRGIRWSDGEPLTVEDYLFFWNDLVLDENVPINAPAGTRVLDEPMQVEKVDDYTLRFTFAGANPMFIELHSRGYYHSSWFMVPAHYLKQYHPEHNTEVKDTNDLLDRYNNRDRYPDMPTYTAWMVTEFRSGERAIFERNPYYWKVDPEGNQLPYIDRVDIQIVQQPEIVVMKGAAGELDAQFRDFPIKDVPMIMEAAEQNDYRVIMWTRGDFAWPWLILYYDYPDAGIVDLMYEQKFRQALSWAINRNRINSIVSLGLGTPKQSTPSANSPEFRLEEGKAVYDEWANSWLAHQPDTASALLDELGLVDANGDGFRERADGSTLELIVDIGVTDLQSIDAMDLVKEDWEAVGLKTTLNVIDGTVLGQRTAAGEVMIRAWGSAAMWGLVSATAGWTPIENVSYNMGGQRIGQWYQTGGKDGVEPRAGSMLVKLQDAYTELITIVDPEERTRKLLEAYRIHITDGPIHIGTVGEHPSPVVVKNNFRNVQDFGVPGPWDLGYPGTAAPEQFFIRQA